jgi:hypothetical protein
MLFLLFVTAKIVKMRYKKERDPHRKKNETKLCTKTRAGALSKPIIIQGVAVDHYIYPRRCHYRHIAQDVAVDHYITQGVAIGLGYIRLAAYLVFFLP